MNAEVRFDRRRSGTGLLHSLEQMLLADPQLFGPVADLVFFMQVDAAVGGGLALQVLVHGRAS
jgi:hypothetical protein